MRFCAVCDTKLLRPQLQNIHTRQYHRHAQFTHAQKIARQVARYTAKFFICHMSVITQHKPCGKEYRTGLVNINQPHSNQADDKLYA